MHFEILVEDKSGATMLDILVRRILDDNSTFAIHAYKGVGHIPKGLKPGTDARKRLLLNRLPMLLQGYGKTFANYPPSSPASVILVCDLDKKCLKEFREELLGILDNCNPRPQTAFCIAVEEGEAWLLGDMAALKKGYPKAKEHILKSYKNDSICGTWELLADAVYPGGSTALSAKGWWAIGKEKDQWAAKITPHMDIQRNNSPSFRYFREKLYALMDASKEQ
jgi:hypothetical protein